MESRLIRHWEVIKKTFSFRKNPFQWASVRILRHLPYIGLASLLFISCGKKQKSETTEQNKQAAKVEVPLQPTDQAVAFIKLKQRKASVMLSTNTHIIWLLV